ncbi:MAG: hypothetical protein V1778_02235 [bacterium]
MTNPPPPWDHGPLDHQKEEPPSVAEQQARASHLKENIEVGRIVDPLLTKERAGIFHGKLGDIITAIKKFFSEG